jgi:4-hydroxy-tetrahydrodipicolinate synthase
VSTVKEATGNIENMRRTRKCCGPHFTILSGDDGMTFQMMTDSQVAASGVISVISNVIPGAVAEMVHFLEKGNLSQAQVIMSKIEPLFNLVTVKTEEDTSFGKVTCRARNPLAIKTLMSILGMPSGGCRKPLGKMTFKGLEVLIATARQVQKNSPEIFKPIENFFDINVEERLNTPSFWEDLCYKTYES